MTALSRIGEPMAAGSGHGTATFGVTEARHGGTRPSWPEVERPNLRLPVRWLRQATGSVVGPIAVAGSHRPLQEARASISIAARTGPTSYPACAAASAIADGLRPELASAKAHNRVERVPLRQ